MSFARVTLIMLAALAVSGTARAERFASMADAQKLIFPNATAFEAKTIRYTAAQMREIERRSGAGFLRNGNRIWIAREATNVLGVIFLDQVFGKHELIDYALGISFEGKVQSVEILEYRESYGGEIRGARWRQQFVGKTANDKLRLNKDIYNLSGATISCRHVTEGVKRLLATYELVVRPGLLAPGSVPLASRPGGAD